MSLRDQLKASSREERAKLKTMSWKDRFWYIWEYYKIHLLGLVILGCVIYLIATIIYNQTFDDQLYYVVMNNENPSGSDFEEFDQAFKDYMGYGKKDRITADGSVYLDFSQASSDAFAYMTKVSALVSSRNWILSSQILTPLITMLNLMLSLIWKRRFLTIFGKH